MTIIEFNKLPYEKRKLLDDKFKRAQKKHFKGYTIITGLEREQFMINWLSKQKQ
jgi:hypothetical protein